MRAGIVASAALAPYTKRGHTLPKPSDFILYDPDAKNREPEPAQSLDDMKAQFAAAKAAFAG